MKKTNFKKIVLFALASLLLIAAFAALGVSAADEATPKVEIITNNVYYGDTLRLMYGVYTENAEGYDLSLDIYDNDYNFICTTVVAHTFDEQIPETYVKDGKECQLFVATAGVPAQDINKVYYAVAKLTKGDEVIESDSYEYSILEYFFERLFVTENVEPEKKEMYRALLSYADIADKVLDGTPEGENIGSYCYVKINDGTMNGGETSGMYLTGSKISELESKLEIAAGKALAWQIDEYYIDGKLKDSHPPVRANEFKEYTIDGVSYVEITPVKVEAEKTSATLVTNINQIKDGSKIIIVAKAQNVAMSTEQKESNRGSIAINKEGNNITIDSDKIQIITLVSQTNGSYLLQVGEGEYLSASGGTEKNQLKTTNDLTLATIYFNISVNSDGTAVIDGINTSSDVRDVIKCYSGNLFNCYLSTYTGAKAISIYVINE